MNWMMRSALSACVAVLGFTAHASATIYFDSESSQVTYSHDPNLGDGHDTSGDFTPSGTTLIGSGHSGASDSLTIVPPTTFGTAYQFKSTNTRPSNGGSSLATVSADRVANSTTLGLQFAAGTGVSQNNPIGAYTGASSLKTDIDGFWYADTNYGAANGFSSFTLGGTVGAGANAFASFNATLHFYELVEGEGIGSASLVEMRSPIVFAQTFKRGNPINNTATTTFTTNGVFSKSFSSSARLNGEVGPIIPPYTTIEIFGQIEFQARNDESPTNIGLLTTGGVFASTRNAAPEPVTATLGVLGSLALGAAATRRRARG